MELEKLKEIAMQEFEEVNKRQVLSLDLRLLKSIAASLLGLFLLELQEED